MTTRIEEALANIVAVMLALSIAACGRSELVAIPPTDTSKLEPAVRNNTIIYPPPPIRRHFELQRVYTSEETRAFTRAWLLFKSGL